MDKQLLRTLLARLNKNAFERFVFELFNQDPREPFVKLNDVGDSVYYQELLDSYGGSLHSVFVLHYSPLELFNKIGEGSIADPEFVSKLKKIRAGYKGQKGYWGMVSPLLKEASKLQSLGFITNFSNIEKSIYDGLLIPQYIKTATKSGIKESIVVGSYDSFIDLVPKKTEEVFRDFVLKNSDGLYISFESEQLNLARFEVEKNLTGGVLPKNRVPYEPIIISQAQKRESILEEFEHLIRKEISESALEKFITAHYKEIFGSKYDRIETQLWLSFPELDISGKNRRTDIFLRNSVSNDWELFEVKRIVELTSTYRDIPVLAKEVMYAIQQIKNYSKILQQDTVKRHFAEQGIEYCNPSLNIIIGKTPQIPHAQWRYLLSINEDEVKILTYDNLLKEMKLRLKDRLEAIS